jgi:putative transposase
MPSARHCVIYPGPPPQNDHGGYLQKGAARKAGLNTSINDAGWYTVRMILAGTAAWAGTRVEALPPAFTTQECSNILADGTVCGERVQNSLSIRTHCCPRCAYIADRDANAARNIQWAGQALRGVLAVEGATNGGALSL